MNGRLAPRGLLINRFMDISKTTHDDDDAIID